MNDPEAAQYLKHEQMTGQTGRQAHGTGGPEDKGEWECSVKNITRGPAQLA